MNELPLLTGIAEEFHKEIVEADYFYDIANSKLTSEWERDENGKSHEVLKKEKEKENKFWGLFSLEGGRKDNVDYIITALKHVVQYLENEYIPNDKIYSDFVKQYEEVRAYKNARQTVADEMNCLTNKQQSYKEKKNVRQVAIEKNSDDYLKDITSAKNSLQSFENEKQEGESFLIKLQDQKGSLNQCIEALKLQKPGFFSFGKVRKEYKKRFKKYSDELEELILAEQSAKEKVAKIEKKLKELQINITSKEAEIAREKKLYEEWDKKAQSEIVELEKHVEKLKQEANCPNIEGLNLEMDYDSLQLSNPWFDKKYRELQSRLFIASLKVRKEFLYKNLKNIRAAYSIWKKQKELLDRKVVISEAWNWMNMVIPVISSTFASFSRMCANLGPETMGSLFVDEAGQALPQASVGAIFRSKHVMVVGDPSQIKPVLTLDSSVLNTLRQCYDISQKYLSEDASTQTLVDAISRYGFYKDDNKEEWIGIPLWVHRRCKHPMFDIANKISYGGNMVQGSKQNGMAQWFDIGGAATDKYVEKQGEFLREKIREMIAKNPDILDKKKKDIIYVISPFKNVAYQLSKELDKIDFTRRENGKPTNVGTVHTFQGKEAPIVFLVLGADNRCTGAANWAMGTENPNIMNVAATRAKEEFYIIGDKKLYLNLNSEVVNSTCEIIDRFTSDSD